MHEIYFLLLLLASGCNSILVILLFKRSLHSTILSTFVVLLLLINAWSIPQLVLISYPFTGDTFIAIDKLSAIGYVFIPVALALFCIAYTGRLHVAKNIYFICLVFIPSIVFLYLAWNTNLIESRIYSEIKQTNWGYAVPIGAVFPLMVVWFLGVASYAMYSLIRQTKHLFDKRSNKQVNLLVIAILIPLLFGTFTNAILPALKIPVVPLAIPLTSITALITTYAIYRYGLFELSADRILSSIGNGVITINNEMKILQINSVARDLLTLTNGTSHEKLLKEIVSVKHAVNPFHPRKEFRNDPVTYVLELGEEIKSHDFIMKLPSGKKFYAEGTISPILQDEVVKGAIIIFRDNSHEKEIEASKNEFISIASHELKTPLTSVIAFSQLLEKNLAEKENTYLIHSINVQLKKMQLLIEDLLNVSRIESGMFVINKKEHSIDNLITKTIKDIQSSTKTHKLIKVGKTSRKLDFDKDRIYQVLVNLLSNAIKYSPKATEVYIYVKDYQKETIVSVQDFGIGIAKRDRDKIFDRFYRSSKEHNKSMAGFGLGLYICSEIIRSHKGKLWVDTKQQKGSTFSFSLPYKN